MQFRQANAGTICRYRTIHPKTQTRSRSGLVICALIDPHAITVRGLHGRHASGHVGAPVPGQPTAQYNYNCLWPWLASTDMTKKNPRAVDRDEVGMAR